MRTAKITVRAAQQAVDATDLDDCCWPDGYTEAAIERLIDEVDRDLADEQHAATVRVSRTFTDARRARRTERRAGREALRSLPTWLEVTDLDGEVAA